MSETKTRPGGRTAQTRLAVHQAVVVALQTHGPDFTYQHLADSSGVSRRTLHRRWPDRNELIYEVLREEYGHFSFTATGNLADDLRTFGLKFRDFSARPTTIMVDGLAALAPNPEFSELSRRAFADCTVTIRQAVAEARAAHGLTDDGDTHLLLQMLICPIVVSCSIVRQPMSDAEVERLAHLVGLAAGIPSSA